MTTKAMDFLSKKRRGKAAPFLVAFGGDEFLTLKVRQAVRTWVLGDADDDFAYSVVDGGASLSSVLDDLRTPPFLGDKRLVVVEAADKFVKQHREALLRYANALSATGVLLLLCDSWDGKTKLYEAVENTGLAIDAKAPAAWTVAAWCVGWAKSEYGKALDKRTAEWLVELVGAHLGLLDQELAKLTAYVRDQPTIDLAAVNRLVAGTRMESAWKLFDLTLEGKIGEALKYLDRQLTAGESAVGILAMLSSQLRKLTLAARRAVNGQALDEALLAAGVASFSIEKSAAALRRFGRGFMAQMYRRLLRADLDLKGGTALSERIVLERFLIDLARGAGVKT